ncbi:unnamed protein product, partial [Meganyctiphanes norvegica]
ITLGKMFLGALCWVLLLLTNHVSTSTSSEQKEMTLYSKHTRFLEVYVLYDNSYASQFNTILLAERYITQVFNIVNAAFKQLGIVVVLAGLEVTQEIKVSCDSNIDNLLTYKRTYRREVDNLMLFTNECLGVGVTL